MRSLIGGTKKNNAFTLIEILLVIIIIGIILALSAPDFSKGYSHFQLNKTVDDLLSISRWAQAMAIGQECKYSLSLARDHRSYHLERAIINEQTGDQDTFEPVNGVFGRRHTLPDAIHLDAQDDRIEFYPDGTIDPATIQLASPEQKTVLSSTEVRGMMTKTGD